MLTATAPDQVPAGRWPSYPEHTQALNQQLAAVSTTLRMTDAGHPRHQRAARHRKDEDAA